MKPKTIIVLLVLLAVCGGYVAIRYTGMFTSGPAKAPTTEQPLFAAPLGEVVKINIAWADGQKVELRRQADQWRLSEPLDARADDLKVAGLVRMLENLQTTRSFEPSDPGQGVPDIATGLDKPRWTITAVDGKGTTATLNVGKAVILQSPPQTYVRPGDSRRTFVARADFATLLPASPQEYRSRVVMDAPAGTVVRLAVEGDQSFDLRKKGSDWSLVQPACPADGEAVRKLLDTVSQITAERFVSDAPANLASLGLAGGKESLVLRLGIEDKPAAPATASAPASASAPAPSRREAVLALGRTTDDGRFVYAKLTDSPSVFLLKASLVQDLQPKLDDLRDRQVLRFKTPDVGGIVVQGASGTASLSLKNGLWQMDAPVAGPADSETVNKLLTALAGLKAQSFADSSTPAALHRLDKPRASVSLQLAGQNEPLSLAVGQTSGTGEMTFVRPAGAPTAAVVRSGDLEAVLASPAAYYNHTLLVLPADEAASRLVLRRPDGTFDLHRDRSGLWTITQPRAATASLAAVTRILDHLAELKADDIVSVGVDVPEIYRKAAEAIEIRLTTTIHQADTASAAASGPATASAPAETTVERVIHVVRSAKPDQAGVCFAWVDGTANLPVGKLPASVFDDLAGDLFDRSVWTFQADDIVAIRMVNNDHEFTLRRNAQGWTFPADTYVTIDSAKVDAFLNELKNLRAERFLSQSSADAGKWGLDKPARIVELTDRSGNTLRLSATAVDAKPVGGAAVVSGTEGVFHLPAGANDLLAKSWKDFRPSEPTPAPPRGSRMPIPGMD